MKDVAKCWTTSGQQNVGGERRLFDNTTLIASSSPMMRDGLAEVMEVAASPRNVLRVEGMGEWLWVVENRGLTHDRCVGVRRMEGWKWSCAWGEITKKRNKNENRARMRFRELYVKTTSNEWWTGCQLMGQVRIPWFNHQTPNPIQENAITYGEEHGVSGRTNNEKKNRACYPQ